ncbi:MAG: alpha/beta fold hydrolase [bacterium]|nr:alpha/beta fold hydrolase [bacterium]
MNIKIKTKDNFILDGILNGVNGTNKGVILAHGMTVDRDDEGIFVRAEHKLNELGFFTLRFDFRAHGKSQGNSVKDFTISGELEDLSSAVTLMLNTGGIKWLGLAGASFGGGISALYAGQHNNQINALFLANPVLDYEKCFLKPTTPWAKEYFENVFERIDQYGFIEVGSRKFKAGRRLFEEMKNFKPCEELRKYKNPLLVVHGDQDSRVSYQDVVNCFSSLPNFQKKLEIIEGAEHGFHEEPYGTQVVDMIIEFFKGSVEK